MSKCDVCGKQLGETCCTGKCGGNYCSPKCADIDEQRKTHLIPDESLGGVLREYVEVDRKAEVGDYVTRNGIIREVEKRSDVYDGVEFEPYLDDDGEDTFGWIDGYYKTLEPTDIIQIDGQRYRMVDHKAEVGEKVIVIYDDSLTVNKGTVLTVTNVTGYDIDTDRKFTIDTRYDEYLVLVPLESADNDSIAVDESEASPSVVEMLGNLARRIVSLERQVKSNATAIVDIQQDIGEIRDKVERLADTCEQSATTIARDVERIDADVERLKQPSTVTIDASVLAKLIAKAVESE